MKKIRVKLNSNVLAPIKFKISVLTLLISISTLILNITSIKIFNQKFDNLYAISFVFLMIFFMEITIVYLFSRYSPIKFLRIRKKLILFSEQLTKQTIDGKFKHSVEWHYITNKKTTIIELYSRGLVSDKKQLSIQLSEYLNENLLSYREFNNHIQLVFGEFPRRYNAMEILTNDKL